MYFDLVKATQTGTDPGYKSKLYFAKTSDITTWARPIAVPVAPGDKKKIVTAHTFGASAGAYVLDCKMYSPVGTSEAQGDPGEKVSSHTMVVEINGDNAKTLEMFEDMLNDELVFWVGDADCLVSDSFVQFGDDCKPADVSYAFNSRKANEQGKKVYTLTINSPKKFFYLATLDTTHP